MDAVIVYLLPLIVGAALLPAWIILALFLLLRRGRHSQGAGLCGRGDDGAPRTGYSLRLCLRYGCGVVLNNNKLHADMGSADAHAVIR